METLDDDLAPIGGHRPETRDAQQTTPGNAAASAGSSIGGLSALGSDLPASLAPVGAGGTGTALTGAAVTGTPATPPLPDSAALTLSPGRTGAGPTPPLDANRPYPLRPDVLREETSSGGSRKALQIAGGGVAAVLALVAYFVFRTPPPVSAPTSFSTFSAVDNSITCDTPEGWETRAVGAAAGDKQLSTSDGVFLTSGSAKIEITTTTVAGQAMGELVLGKEVVPESMTGSPAGALHRRMKKGLAGKLKGYQETAVPQFKSQIGGYRFEGGRFVPDARLSEFTATGNKYGFGGKVHGYRASLTGKTLIASVVCQSPSDDWQKLKPAFLRVIASLRDTVPVQEDDGPGPGLPGGIPMLGGHGR